jgi:hypothetical protein
MNENLTNELSCSVFGHNLYRSNSHNTKSTELVCSSCKAKIYTDPRGDFHNSPFSNYEVQKVLRQLFLLESKTQLHTIYL